MEDTFRVRVDRAFGSLSSSSSSSSFSQPLTSSLWCLSDEEIEKRPWNRDAAFIAGDGESNDTDDDDDGPFPSSVDRLFAAMKGKLEPDEENENPNPNPNPGELEDDLKELDDDTGEGTSDGGSDRGSSSSNNRARETVDDVEEEELDVRNAIGMDCTLDFEEEEDENDKLAAGVGNTGDRIYMADVTRYMPGFHSLGEIRSTFKKASGDPHANHLAAKLRLKEDAEAARSFNSLQVSERAEAVTSDAQNNTSENGSNLKSILKRKEDQMVSKSEKRVRFESSCKSSDEVSEEQNHVLETSNGEATLHEKVSSQYQYSSLIPDYVRNPSKYTHYTFDSSNDMNEESNRQAYMDFRDMLKKSKQSEPEEVPADLSMPVIFNPKKNVGQVTTSMTSDDTDLTKEITMEEPMHRKKGPLSFPSESDETSEMEVDELATGATKVGGGQRTARRYYSKQRLESNDSDS